MYQGHPTLEYALGCKGLIDFMSWGLTIRLFFLFFFVTILTVVVLNLGLLSCSPIPSPFLQAPSDAGALSGLQYSADVAKYYTKSTTICVRITGPHLVLFDSTFGLNLVRRSRSLKGLTHPWSETDSWYCSHSTSDDLLAALS